MRRPVSVTSGFCLVILWFAAVNGWNVLGVVFMAAAVHEVGHCLALVLLGAKITGLRLSLFGAELETDSRRLSYGGEVLAVLAGPISNLLCALVLSKVDAVRWAVVTGANVARCLFNLRPVRPLDGGRALYLLAAWMAGPAAGERVIRWAGVFSGTVLAAGLGYVMWRTGGSLWLLPPMGGLLAAAWRELVGRDGL